MKICSRFFKPASYFKTKDSQPDSHPEPRLAFVIRKITKNNISFTFNNKSVTLNINEVNKQIEGHISKNKSKDDIDNKKWISQESTTILSTEINRVIDNICIEQQVNPGSNYKEALFSSIGSRNNVAVNAKCAQPSIKQILRLNNCYVENKISEQKNELSDSELRKIKNDIGEYFAEMFYEKNCPDAKNLNIDIARKSTARHIFDRINVSKAMATAKNTLADYVNELASITGALLPNKVFKDEAISLLSGYVEQLKQGKKAQPLEIKNKFRKGVASVKLIKLREKAWQALSDYFRCLQNHHKLQSPTIEALQREEAIKLLSDYLNQLKMAPDNQLNIRGPLKIMLKNRFLNLVK